MVARDGANVESRVVARLVEVALVTIAMEHWIDVIDPAAPFQDTSPRLDTGDAMGLTEAARGSLGHWLRLDQGRISHYQIIAPTTWNFSPRDAAGTPGPSNRRSSARPCAVARPSRFPCSISCAASIPAWSVRSIDGGAVLS
jgi:hydrogenase large subunit